MDTSGFRTYLRERSLAVDAVEQCVGLIERFDSFARNLKTGDAEDADREAVHRFAEELISDGTNTWDNIVALARYGAFSRNQEMYLAALELVDGAEVLENLHRKLEDALGKDVRDRLFAGIDLPPLGVTTDERSPQMRTVIERLEREADSETCKRILGSGLRNLEDSWYTDQKKIYEDAGSIEAYLKIKGQNFLAELERHKNEGSLFFNQPITDRVISFVRSQPEIASGVRIGDILYETKIPHQAVEYLEVSDPNLKRYFYCHCPWAKESLREGADPVSPTFCNCSAAFHKKPYETILGQSLEADVVESVLGGALCCRFAIHLPPGTP